MLRTPHRGLKSGDRVRVVSTHLWLPGRYGTIKAVEKRTGNRFLVKFDREELGMWHDEGRDPVLRLKEEDLILDEESLGAAA